MPPVRSQKQKEYHRELIGTWLNKGWSQERIAKELGVSVRQAQRDIATVRDEWRRTLDEHWTSKQREIEDINRQIDALWDAWEKSKQIQLSQSEEEGDAGKAGRVKLTRKEARASYGDPRIMAEITKLRDMRNKIVGMYAPVVVKADVTHRPAEFTQEHEARLEHLATILERRLAETGKPRGLGDGEGIPEFIEAETRLLTMGEDQREMENAEILRHE